MPAVSSPTKSILDFHRSIRRLRLHDLMLLTNEPPNTEGCPHLRQILIAHERLRRVRSYDEAGPIVELIRDHQCCSGLDGTRALLRAVVLPTPVARFTAGWTAGDADERELATFVALIRVSR